MPKVSPLFLTNTAKTCLKHTFLQPDPRTSMQALGRLDEALADTAAEVFRQLIAARATQAARPLQVLELGCAYGVGAALLRFPLSFATLHARYTARDLQALDPVELEELDRLYYAAWPRSDQHRYVGVDARESAVRYAHRVGTVDCGIPAQLDSDDPDGILSAEILRSDIIVDRGRLSARTAARLAQSARRDDPPWIACFLPRTAPVEAIAAALGRLGLRTEKFAGGSFAQRRFESAAEKEHALSVLARMGIDPAGREAEGWRHVELYVARPDAIADTIPLHRMVSLMAATPRRLRGAGG
ncbi:MAG TPA: hypothetical protein VJ890_11845 [Vineibacter sp.]|nr:hypothetical protein [Vineibacter sp.]